MYHVPSWDASPGCSASRKHCAGSAHDQSLRVPFPPHVVKDAMSKVRGVVDLAVFTSLGQPTLRIDIDRKAAARYGLAPGDINAAVQTAVGGQAGGDLYEEGSGPHFPLVARLGPKDPPNIETNRQLTN